MEEFNKRQAQLKEVLDGGGLCYAFPHPSDISEPLILILGLHPAGKNSESFSLGLPLESYYEGSDNIKDKKCWLPYKAERIQTINNNRPAYYEAYNKFEYGRPGDDPITYHPYSVDLSAHNLQDLQSIKKLCFELYSHVIHQ